jgi:glycine dehydrogenase subunit 2
MGFDIVHLNLHKTFATPHGGGGPGAGPVAVAPHLVEFLPGPRPVRLAGRPGGSDDAGPRYGWHTPARSIGRVHGWHGNALVLARALAYIEVHGADGLYRVAQRAVLNANWIRQRLSGTFDVPFDRPCMHEVVFSAAALHKRTGSSAFDVAKGLIEEGFHPPTVAFPLIVEDALMVEPTETESYETLVALAEALERVAARAESGTLEGAPRTTPVRRVDDARAARILVPTFDARR